MVAVREHHCQVKFQRGVFLASSAASAAANAASAASASMFE
jgi:hypothetical protein